MFPLKGLRMTIHHSLQFLSELQNESSTRGNYPKTIRWKYQRKHLVQDQFRLLVWTVQLGLEQSSILDGLRTMCIASFSRAFGWTVGQLGALHRITKDEVIEIL